MQITYMIQRKKKYSRVSTSNISFFFSPRTPPTIKQLIEIFGLLCGIYLSVVRAWDSFGLASVGLANVRSKIHTNGNSLASVGGGLDGDGGLGVHDGLSFYRGRIQTN